MADILERLNTALAGRYTIDRELGRGGMAVVFLARDERHQRLVAIKVMLPEVVDGVGTERFRREIQIAARLNHPNILTVFDSGEVEDLFYYVMPFVEGESLEDAIVRARQLTIPEAVSIARHVADALDYAHSEGVVHRDIKPANILLAKTRVRTGGGGGGRSPVVTDFGIARAMTGEAGKRLTSTGLMVGTPTYMSPEQFGADEVDGRADQYALACVLYEMLIGEPPFTGASPMVVLARHTREMVPSLRAVRPTIPEALEQAIFRAMSKIPADRYASTADFADAISAATEGPIIYGTADHAVPATTTSHAVMPYTAERGVAVRRLPQLMNTGLVDVRAPTMVVQKPKGALMRRRVMVAGTGVITVLGALGIGLRYFQSKPPERLRLMVLPFRNTGPVGDSAFADGLTEEIISRLSGVPRLGVVARTSTMKYKGSVKSAKEIGAELNVRKLVQGTVTWKGGADTRQATVSVQIVDAVADTETPVSDSDYNAASLNDIYSIASAVAAKLDLTKELNVNEQSRLTAHSTENRDAYEAFLQGNRFYNHSWDSTDVKAAIVSYENAVRLDPAFKLALAALGRAHGWMYQLRYDPRDSRLVFAKQFIDSSLRLDPDLAEGHLALGLYNYWGKRDYDGAMKEFRIVRAALPSSAETYNFIGNISRRRGALPEAVDNYRLSADLDPRAHQVLFNLAETQLFLREFEDSEKLADRVMEIAPDFIDGPILKATLQIHRLGDRAAARRILADLTQRSPGPRWRSIGHHWRAGLFRIVDDSLSSAEQRIVVNSFGLDTANYLTARAEMYRRFGQSANARIYYDSAAQYMDATVKRHPEWGQAHGQLGLAYAGLGRGTEAGKEAELARSMQPETADALDGPEWVVNVAQTYAIAGNIDKAMEWLTYAMTIPSRLSPKWVELDPVWMPLRNDPRFRALVTKPPSLGNPGTRPK